MQHSVTTPEFERRTAEYFSEKAKQAKGTGKMLVALEMSNYLRDARRNGLTFEELKQQGFKFATLPHIED